MMKTTIHLLFFSMFFLGPAAFAAPSSISMSGTVLDGESITISGTGFGATGPNVVLFDDFESGTSGNDIATGINSAKYGRWNAKAGYYEKYSNSYSVSGSLSFHSDYSGQYNRWIETLLPANTRSLFISWWLFIPSGQNFPGEGTADGINWKQMWVQGADTIDDDMVVPTRHSSWQINGNDSDPGYAQYVTVDFNKGTWKHLKVWLKGSTSSTSNDGEVKFYDLTSSGLITRLNDVNVNTLKETGEYERVRPNGYGRNSNNTNTYFDDIYVATGPNAQARVEVGNGSTYNDSTKLTILTPTEWTDTEIIATVNTGSFSAGDTAFLYIVDADGAVNASGYAVTIGNARASIKATGTPATISNTGSWSVQ